MHKKQSLHAQSSKAYTVILFSQLAWTLLGGLHALCPGGCDKVAAALLGELSEPQGALLYRTEVDELLLKQHPPYNFTRAPRSLAKHLNYWKASEFRTWLLYYSLPILSDFLPSLYIQHTALLVTAMHILLKQEISESQVDAAEAMIDTFCKLLRARSSSSWRNFGRLSCCAAPETASTTCW